ncbi:polygalacturonase QRT3 isoform X2 [Daucus carota subsp. sativus]|uniref:polygalacturonase QRT3 isoform X2 n=1 Tax=Daucus carota subsp. sativus TaxID=79200 RepID=UPI003082BCE8
MMGRAPILPSKIIWLLSYVITIHAFHDILSPAHHISAGHYRENTRKMHLDKVTFSQHDSTFRPPSPIRRPSLATPTTALLKTTPSTSDTSGVAGAREYHVITYGADPTGKNDSTDAILGAIADAVQGPGHGELMKGILNLGGVRINLDGGIYKISRPLRLPVAGRGNLVIHGGTLKASDDFPKDGYLIDLSASSKLEYIYEFVTLRDLLLDSNYRGGAIQVVDSLRTSIDNCYITHFTTTGINVQGGHETYIRNCYLGQHITAGADPGERDFSGTAIILNGNDNAVTDVVIFSAATGIVIEGQANTLSGVHCYNKATGFGGVGVYLKVPGLTQTRIVNCYLDYTGIVAEDPVQLHISSSFFLGDAFILLRSVNGIANGINIVDNMFSGSDKDIDIVQLDEKSCKFKNVKQVIVDRNNAKGMNMKSTIARGTVEGNNSSWMVDLSRDLLFPNLIRSVQYSLQPTGDQFPNHALRSVTDNRVVITTDVVVPASVTVTVDQ